VRRGARPNGDGRVTNADGTIDATDHREFLKRLSH
jgi:hypothetical protein